MKQIITFLILLPLLFSCIKNNTDPSWIQVNKFTLVVNPNINNSQGVLTENITDAWIYVNNDLIGVFELPCTIPVLKSGSAEIRVYPAILNNGISATKKIYPFLNYHTTFTNLTTDSVVTINPVTSYKDATKFWIEDFEGATIKIQEGNPSPASILVQSNDNNTNQYGRVLLNASQNAWAAYTTDELSFPLGTDVYLEVDYYNTNSLVTGLLINKTDGSSTNNLNIQLNSQSAAEVKWKKIYIELKEVVNASQGIGFLQTFQASLDEGNSEGLILIDNIKIVHY